mmetsp:Transcript_102639/g.185133  ORF Transcript_102639/g.185133 Transcript_102639/m.185133 type:complete len:271 (-) Transcript_102639:99-911(-)
MAAIQAPFNRLHCSSRSCRRTLLLEWRLCLLIHWLRTRESCSRYSRSSTLRHRLLRCPWWTPLSPLQVWLPLVQLQISSSNSSSTWTWFGRCPTCPCRRRRSSRCRHRLRSSPRPHLLGMCHPFSGRGMASHHRPFLLEFPKSGRTLPAQVGELAPLSGTPSTMLLLRVWSTGLSGTILLLRLLYLLLHQEALVCGVLTRVSLTLMWVGSLVLGHRLLTVLPDPSLRNWCLMATTITKGRERESVSTPRPCLAQPCNSFCRVFCPWCIVS